MQVTASKRDWRTVDYQPNTSERGLPVCSENECRQYDGKRCRAMGCRPSILCEPALVEALPRQCVCPPGTVVNTGCPEHDEDAGWRAFGAAVRLARMGAGLTMGDVARRLGVSVSTISALETGEDRS